MMHARAGVRWWFAVAAVVLATAPIASLASWRRSFAVDRAHWASSGSNPYFVLEPGYRLVYGHGRSSLTVTVLDATKVVDGVETRVVEEREEENGRLVELSRNYLALDASTGDVYYFGEDSESPPASGAVSKDGSWLTGVGGATFGLLVPARFRLGDRFFEEQAPKVAMDRAEVVAGGVTFESPAGTFRDCVRVKETSPLEGGASVKLYAPGVGVVRDDELVLLGIERQGVPQVWVPAGSFVMGTDDASIEALNKTDPPAWVKKELPSERPAHSVRLTKGFWIDTYEVTNAAFQAFVDRGGYTTRAPWSEAGWAWLAKQDVAKLPLPCPGTAPSQPRRCVTWFEAEAFATSRGGRLPTEAEWEFAARGPRSSVYPWGNDFDPSRCNVVGSQGPTAVGTYPTGISWVGAHDMAGNAMEWVEDWLDVGYYAHACSIDPTGPATGTVKVEKGGWWGSNPFVARSAYRHYEDPPDYGDTHIGFRVVIP